MATTRPPAALGFLDVRVVDTDYHSFAVLYIYKELEGVLSTMVQLYSEARPSLPSSPGPSPSGPSPGPPLPPGLPLPGLGPARIRWHCGGGGGPPHVVEGQGLTGGAPAGWTLRQPSDTLRVGTHLPRLPETENQG